MSMLEKSILDYKKNKKNKREIIQLLSPYILKTPSYYGTYDKDSKHEFFAIIIGNIEKILDKYTKHENCTFKSWFSIVLKNQFFKFLKKKTSYEMINNFSGTEIIENTIEENITNENEIKLNLDRLSTSEKAVVEHKFGFENKYYNFNISDKISKKRELETRIAKKYTALLKIQKQIINTMDLKEKEALKNKEKQIKAVKRKLELRSAHFKLEVTNKILSDEIGVAEGTISSYMNRIRIKIRNNPESFLYKN